LTAARFTRLCERWLPRPQLVHPYPEVRFDATHPVGAVCAGALGGSAGAVSNGRYRDPQPCPLTDLKT
jgi:hypothetical protein